MVRIQLPSHDLRTVRARRRNLKPSQQHRVTCSHAEQLFGQPYRGLGRQEEVPKLLVTHTDAIAGHPAQPPGDREARVREVVSIPSLSLPSYVSRRCCNGPATARR